jgi:hypothetical protein
MTSISIAEELDTKNLTQRAQSMKNIRKMLE